MSSLLDVVVVGGGFAGISAALTFGRARHAALLIHSGPTRNAKAHAANGFSTHEGALPGDILKKSFEELKKYEATVKTRESLVTRIIKTSTEGESPRFKISLSDGTDVESRRVVLASGVRDVIPAIDGLEKIWGKKAHICPYCDGFEYGTEGHLGVIANGAQTFNMVNMLAQQWTPKVTLFASKEFLTAPLPDGKSPPALHPKVKVLPPAASVQWHGTTDNDPVDVYDAEGKKLASVNGIFAPTKWEPQSQLAKELGADLHPMGFVLVNSEFESSIAGLSAVGDLAWVRGAKMPSTRIAEAVGSGARAAGWISVSTIAEAVTAITAPAASSSKSH